MIPELSIVAPMRNEAGNVEPLAQQVFAAFPAETHHIELILVDDASTDGTWEKLLEVRRTDPRLIPIRHLQLGGQSAALWTAFRACRAEILATLDGDLQNDPADLPRLLKELTHCDLVCGVRTNRQDNQIRKISSRVARLARRVVLNVDFRDSGCNLRVFRRSILESIPAFDGFHRFMPILAEGAGALVREIQVGHRPRISGNSNYGIWNRLGRGIYDLVMIRWYRKRQLRHIPTVTPDPAPGAQKEVKPVEGTPQPRALQR